MLSRQNWVKPLATQKRIYIDTSIPSAYYTLRTDAESRIRQRATRQWWEKYADLFTITSSTAVVLELSRGKHDVKQARLALLKNIQLFESIDEIQKIVQVYIDKLIIRLVPVNYLFLMFSQILGFVLYTYRPYGTKECLFDVFYKHIVPTGLMSVPANAENL